MTKTRDTILGSVNGTKSLLDGTFLLKVDGKWYEADESVDVTQLYLYNAWEVNDRTCMQYRDEFPKIRPL